MSAEPQFSTATATRGMALVAVGLASLGLSGFVFLGLVGRGLGATVAAPVTLAWTLINAIGIGLFAPLEQEGARILAAARATGTAQVRIRRVSNYLAGSLAVLALIALVFHRALAQAFFSNDRGVLVATAAALAAMAASYFTRGRLAGSGQFGRYGAQLALDGVGRMVGATALFITDTGTPTTYVLVLAVSPLVAIAATVTPSWLVFSRQVPAAGAERTGLTPLVATSLSSQMLANLGPLAVALIAAPEEVGDVSRFVAAITVARVPLFVFSALQSVFLPSLAGLIGKRDVPGFGRALRLGLVATNVLAWGGFGAIVVAGSWLLHLIYGADFEVALADLGLIAASGALFMVAQVLAQCLLALRQDWLVAAGWTLGIVVTIAALAIPLGATTRTALALVIGSAMAALALAVTTVRCARAWRATVASEPNGSGSGVE